MDYLVIVLLIGLWGVVFLPATLRTRHESSPISSIGTFRRGMRALSEPGTGQASAGGRWVVMPKTRADETAARRSTLQRRRRILISLTWLAVGTGLISVVGGGGAAIGLHIVLDVLLVGYVLLLIQIKNSKVRQFDASLEVEESRPEEDFLRVEHF